METSTDTKKPQPEEPVPSTSGQNTKPKRPRCSHCRFHGHTKSECRKYKAAKEDEEEDGDTKFSRPILDFHIDGVHKTAILSTGVPHSVASTRLQNFLKRKGYMPTLKLASTSYIGSADKITQELEVFNVPITVQERTILTTFTVPPKTTRVQNVLGMDFIGRVLWFSPGPERFMWHFHDKPEQLYNFSRSRRIKAMYDKYMIYGVYIRFL